MLKKIGMLLMLVVSVQFAKAQLSYDLIQFGNDYEKYIENLGNPSAKEAVGEFLGYYHAGRLSNPQKMLVIKLTNQMVNMNLGVALFDNYLRSMNGLISNNQVDKFDSWHKALNLSLTKSKDDFAAFLQISRNIFADHIIAQQGAMKWVSSNIDINLQTKGEPAIVVNNTDLICYTPGDTLEIYGTSGMYIPSRNIWVGRGGKLDWTRVGVDTGSMYAQLLKYTIEFSSGTVTADSALFYYPLLFEKPLAGKVIDKAMTQSMGDKSVYPQFQSFQRVLNNFSFGRAKYTGGFGMRGKVIIGRGVDSTKAEMVFTYKDKPTLKLQADEFVVRGPKIHTQKAAAIIMVDKDSIYHPQVEFTYRLNDHFVSLYRSEQGIAMAPFYDSYHNIEFYCDEIRWSLDDPKIDIDMINDNQPAKFESVNYFRDVRYEKVQGMLDYNPLVRVKQYTEKHKINGFYIETYAKFFKSNKSDIKVQMIELNDKGFINYNPKTEYVTVKRKLIDYVNAHAGKTDFDAIAFFSIIKRYSNATLSLINNDLNVQGVPKFFFSDSQNVSVVPKDQMLTLKKNRNMDFSGKLHAGKVDFYGNGFSFDYNNFQIRLSNVDSMKFYYKDGKTGEHLPVKSALQNIYGTLSIDHPHNKSGRKKYPGYPIFKSDVGAKVYYDKPTTYNGIYNRNRYFFEVDPFTIDSLNELDFDNLNLEGTFVSGNIVPEFKTALKLQPDKSLGFQIDAVSYPMYGGKGKGNLALSVSDEGFFGNGDLVYLTSTSRSDKFELFLDSMNAHCNSFVNTRSSVYPTIDAVNTYEVWYPYGDSLFVSHKTEEMKVSDKRADFAGTLLLTPVEMTARGNVNIDKAQLTSASFHFRPDNILTDSALFRLKNYNDSTKFAFRSSSVRGDLDLKARKGDFTFNQGGLNSEFAYNYYAGSFEEFLWLIDEKTVDFRSKTQDPKATPSYLVSTRGSQDSLMFNTASTVLDLKDYTLYSAKIPYIAVGDAHIFPDSQKVVVRADAEMDLLTNAKIIADTVEKYHQIENAELKISGKFLLRGTGNYEYVDRKKNKQKFLLNEISIDKDHHLLGKTDIPDSINFYVGTKIRFHGRAFVKSIVKNLEYEGFFLPLHEMPLPRTDWFRTAAVINPDSVFIRVEAPLVNKLRQALMNGFVISNDSTHLYAAFFSRKRNGSDPELMRVEGVLFFDEKANEFKMGSYDKIFKESLKGNVMRVNEGTKLISGEGRFNLGFEAEKKGDKLPAKFDFTVAGTGVYSLADTTFSMRLAGLLNFPMPPTAVKIMYDSLSAQSVNAAVPTFEPLFMKKALAELVDDKNIKKVTDDVEPNSVKLTPELQRTIFFTELNMKWNQATRSLHTVGDLGINSFDKYALERNVKGRLEIVKRRSGDDFTLYIQGDQGSWYFFKYQRGMMNVVGSDPLFNQYIKDNIDKLSKDEFKLRLANVSARNQFLKAMKKQQQE
jgi:hypothetical protein